MPSDPRKVYKMRPIIEAVVDRDSFFEIGRAWGKSIITGLARLDGVPVALFAEDPFVYGGAWTADACRKLTRFIDLSAIFHLPLVHLVDCPGFLIGKQSEEDSTIRFGSTTLAALGQSPVPFVSVVVRKAFGVAGAANHKPGSHHVRVAWPSGDWGSLPIEGGIEVAYKAELAEVARSGRTSRRDQGAPESAAFAVPVGRVLRNRRDHRPARHARGAHALGSTRTPSPATRRRCVRLSALAMLTAAQLDELQRAASRTSAR